MELICKEAISRSVGDIFYVPEAYTWRMMGNTQEVKLEAYNTLMNEEWNIKLTKKVGVEQMISYMYKRVFAEDQRIKSLYEDRMETDGGRLEHLLKIIAKAGGAYEIEQFEESIKRLNWHMINYDPTEKAKNFILQEYL
jgi:hypothetical protein